jgi:hypothetical protein
MDRMSIAHALGALAFLDTALIEYVARPGCQAPGPETEVPAQRAFADLLPRDPAPRQDRVRVLGNLVPQGLKDQVRSPAGWLAAVRRLPRDRVERLHDHQQRVRDMDRSCGRC